jgi:superfamily II DNA/RNA helicase
MAISLCDPSERAFLRDIERLIRQTIPKLEMPGEVQAQRKAA